VGSELLHATKIGRELNNEFWKGAGAPPRIQKMSKSLVQKWLREHRSTPIHAISDKRIESTAASLEQNIYNLVFQKSGVRSHAATVDFVSNYRTLTLKTRKYFTHPTRLGRERLCEIFDGDKTESEVVGTLHRWPDSYFNRNHEFVGPGKVHAPMISNRSAKTGLPQIAIANSVFQRSNGGASSASTSAGALRAVTSRVQDFQHGPARKQEGTTRHGTASTNIGRDALSHLAVSAAPTGRDAKLDRGGFQLQSVINAFNNKTASKRPAFVAGSTDMGDDGITAVEGVKKLKYNRKDT